MFKNIFEADFYSGYIRLMDKLVMLDLDSLLSAKQQPNL